LLKSLFENHTTNQLCVNLLYIKEAVKEKDLDFWEQYTTSHGHLFRKLPVPTEYVGTLKETRHTKTTYLRFWLPELLPDCVTKVICIDADLIILRNLSDLYQINISNYYVAVAKETINVYAKFDKNMFSRINNLGISSDDFYFQSGVMLMNLQKMREDDIVSKCIRFANKIDQYPFMSNPDQDTLNAVLHSAVKYIPPKYNMNYNVEPDVLRTLWSPEEVREAKKSPVIIHYIGPTKPWNYLSFHPQTKLWWKYLKMTPFKDYKPQNKSFGNFFKKYYLIICWQIMSHISLSQKRKIGKLLPDGLKGKFKKSVRK
jgi:lipopolysaccharide biosynthesis glycosyltransferase